MVNMILSGCNGKMGHTITELAKEDPDIRIVAGVDKAGTGSGDYPVFKKLSDVNVSADVVVDFSNPKALNDNNMLEIARERKYALVLCTTGYSEEEIIKIRDASRDIAILRSANMSLGINLLLKLVSEAAKVLSAEGFDTEIIEKHHNKKLDAPSGTAIMLADSINHVLNDEFEYKYDRHSECIQRNKKEIGISSVRGGNIVGEHEVIFAGTDEVIEFKHTAYSKAVFGKGAIAAAKFICGREPKMYSMDDVIKF